MKKRLLLPIMAIATMVGFSSCDEELKSEELTRIIESVKQIVTGCGLDSTLTSKIISDIDGATSTLLSYKSWIIVEGQSQTKAGVNVITVDLTDKLTDVDIDLINDFQIEDFNSINEKTELRKELRGSKVDLQKNVTTYDSVYVYTVKHGDFEFSYELLYQVPVYDNGELRYVMPYHRYENIEDKGFTIEPQDAVIGADGTVYTCALYTRRLDVTVNGQVYPLYARVRLLKEQAEPGEPYVVRSDVAKSYTIQGGYIESNIVISKEWSTGEVTNEEYSVNLCCSVDPVNRALSAGDYKNDLEFKDMSLVVDSIVPVEKSGNITKSRHIKQYALNFNYFSAIFEVYVEEASFDDGTVMCDFESNPLMSVEFSSYFFRPELTNETKTQGNIFVLLNTKFEKYEEEETTLRYYATFNF
jgi:hypothetical protein